MSSTKKQFLRFIIVGICTVFIDYIGYNIFLLIFSLNVSKGLSFLLGSVFAFLINKIWTFENKQKPLRQIVLFGILYSVTLVINVLTNALVIQLCENFLFSFFIATGVSALLNFIGQNWLVFKQ